MNTTTHPNTPVKPFDNRKEVAVLAELNCIGRDILVGVLPTLRGNGSYVLGLFQVHLQVLQVIGTPGRPCTCFCCGREGKARGIHKGKTK